MIKHITFATDDMSISADKCIQSAMIFGCDESMIFTPDFYTNEFYHFNEYILDEKRGAGFWLWKPYFIYQELLNLDAFDILIYTDAGLIFENNVHNLISAMNKKEEEIMLFDNRWIHGDWCKMDVLMKMNCNEQWIIDHTQLQASCIILKRTPITIWLIKEWLMWCQMPGMIDDSKSRQPNLPGFQEHRHDQAILTNVALKYGIHFHWWPVQYFARYKQNYPNDNYPLTFYHHRKRNDEW